MEEIFLDSKIISNENSLSSIEELIEKSKKDGTLVGVSWNKDVFDYFFEVPLNREDFHYFFDSEDEDMDDEFFL